MSRQLDDLQLDAELRHFLQLRADDTASVRDAAAMSQAIAAGSTAGTSGRTIGQATWLVLAAALLAIAAIAAIGVGGLRRSSEVGPEARPSNGWIAYAPEHRRGPTDVFVVRDGVEPRPIAGPSAGVLPGICPAFSPDGRLLAYGESGGNVVVVTLDDAGAIVGPRQRLPVQGSPFAPCPTWSPDSRGVAFLDGPALDILWLDGSSTILRNEGWGLDSTDFPSDHDVAWSPMGDSLAIARPSGTWLALVDGREARLLDPTPANSLSWAPDGSAVVIDRAASGGMARVVSVEGEKPTLDLPGAHGPTIWSSAGDVIYTGGVAMRLDGSEAHELADCGFTSILSPDGSRMLCALDIGGGYALKSIPASGDGEAITIVPFVGVSGRAWPTSENFSWQPVFAEASSEAPISTSEPTSGPSATATPVITPRIAGQGPVLRWTRVALAEELAQAFVPLGDARSQARIAWLGDRFVLADDDAGAIATSSDGRSWALLAADDPFRALYERALAGESGISTWRGADLAQPLETAIANPPSEGALGAVGIGPRGIVARTHSTLDFDAFITTKIGTGWAEQLQTFDYSKGILRITTTDGRFTNIDWADEGFKPGDVADRGFGWYSRDGASWPPIPDFPANVSEIVGVPDGFIARGGDGLGTGIWHSADGLIWRRLGGSGDGTIIPWTDGVIETDAIRRFDSWSATGEQALPMAVELPDTWTASAKAIGAGPLGVVTVGIGDRTILFSPDGAEWRLQAMPDSMVMATRGRLDTNVAIGDGVVVILARTGEGDAAGPAIWLGALEP